VESLKKWLRFERKYQAYLWALRGGLIGVTPLAYVVRPYAAVTMDQIAADFDSIEQDLYETSAHEGDHYTVDNGRVFVILKRIYADTPLYHLIKPFERTRNRRGAFLVLKNHFEGTAMIEERKHAVLNIIEQAFYMGKNDKSYSLDDYINKHLEAHQELAELEQPVDKGYKISQFLKNIHDESLKLTVNMIRVHGGPLMTDFHLMVSKIQEPSQWLGSKTLVNAKATRAGTETVAMVSRRPRRKAVVMVVAAVALKRPRSPAAHQSTIQMLPSLVDFTSTTCLLHCQKTNKRRSFIYGWQRRGASPCCGTGACD
jgi:hypothetical protein